MVKVAAVFALALVVAGLAAPHGCAGSYHDYALHLLAHPPEGVVVREDVAAALVASTNAYRQSRRVAAAQPSDEFAGAARAQAMDMAAHDYVGHRSSTGHDFEVRMRAFLGNPMLLPPMAEIAARDSRGAADVAARVERLTRQWVTSQAHRRAMINRGYPFVSTAAVEKNGRLYAVQIYFSAPPSGNSGLFAPLPLRQEPAVGGGLY